MEMHQNDIAFIYTCTPMPPSTFSRNKYRTIEKIKSTTPSIPLFPTCFSPLILYIRSSMESNKRLSMVVALVVLLGLVDSSAGAVFKVGDSAGWTTIGNVNYGLWASTKTFMVGDTVVFTYNKNFHNLLEVSKADYKSCNAASPIATYMTGNDSIVLKSAGPQYFLCGFPGHCAAGQKVEIDAKQGSSAAPSMAPEAPSPASGAEAGRSTATTPAPTPNANGAASTGFSVGFGIVLLLAALCF